jgi:hypothetical protein
MPIRQVIPDHPLDSDALNALRLEDEHAERREERAARGRDVNWNPAPETQKARCTIGGIAPPGSASFVAARAPSDLAPFGGGGGARHRIERRSTGAKRSRMLITLVPLALITLWLWHWIG